VVRNMCNSMLVSQSDFPPYKRHGGHAVWMAVGQVRPGFDQRSPFEHTGKVTFHLSQTSCSRYVQIIIPNPKFVDGEWISREGDVEGTLYVLPSGRRWFEILLPDFRLRFQEVPSLIVPYEFAVFVMRQRRSEDLGVASL